MSGPVGEACRRTLLDQSILASVRGERLNRRLAKRHKEIQNQREAFVKIGVLGTGMVGNAIASGFAAKDHEVRMGAREAGNEKAREWARSTGGKASSGTFQETAAFAEVVFNATRGDASLDALRAAGSANLRGKVLVDVANPLDFSRGMPPTLFTAAAGDSLAERIQKEFPDAHVVKALNTITAAVMISPRRAGGPSDLFICGNDAGAKGIVRELLEELGWTTIHDLGDITAARGTEAYLLLWLRLWGALQTPDFNVRVVKAGAPSQT
jgi:predicted dinucleotide-binding enzyme